MPRPTEPVIVTLAEHRETLARSLAEKETQLAEAEAEARRAALDVETQPGEDAVRKRTSAKRRREKLAEELAQLHDAMRELDERLERERQDAAARARREALADYGKHRDAVKARAIAALAHIEDAAADIDAARRHARAADALGRSLGFPLEGYGRGMWPEVGALKNVLNGLLSGQARVVREARERVERDWRTTPNGRRAVALLAALGDADATE